MEQSDTTSNPRTPEGVRVQNSKVDRVIREYDLRGLGETVEHHWTGAEEPQFSLRQLADIVNEHILRAAMERAGMQILDGEVENTYRLLTDDDVSAGMRIQTEKTLQRSGIDTDQLQHDFVSHQAIHTYLTKFRGVKQPQNDTGTDPVTKAIRAIQRLKSRMVAVSETTLERLENTDRIDIGDFEVLVDVRVLCNDCDAHLTITETLQNGGCGCPSRVEGYRRPERVE